MTAFIRGIRDPIPAGSVIGRLGTGTGAPTAITLADLSRALTKVSVPATVPLVDPVNPTLYAAIDSSGAVTKVKVTTSFPSGMPLPPTGMAIMYSMFDVPNSVTIASGGTGTDLVIGTVDILAQGTLTILAGSTTTSIVNTTSVNPNDTTFPLSSKYWAQFGTSQWRKATGVTSTAYQFEQPFDITPVAGDTLNWVEIGWFDSRSVDTTGIYGRVGESYRLAAISNGTQYEIVSWSNVTQISGNFHITCTRGLEGTTPISADGLSFHYFPAPGSGTNLITIPAHAFTQGSNGSWVGETDVNVNIPAGYSVSMSCCVYAQVGGALFRSDIVPLSYGGTYS